MSYLRLFYQLATQARPSDGHPPRFDGSTVRISRAWEFSRRDGLAFSRGNDGLKLVWLSPEERMAGHFRIVGDKSGCVCSCSDSSTDLKIGVSKYPKKGE
ncbi:predicted protein [Histoplasma capsulatum H143]|uniref:Uncharacterized protein n=1 Tax=Ajellomyces capsulatus (strain H143) TaxID=544712 RepID=C6H4J0_AJECH|nr:predicted protein [Histoplasma capsulatum H143]